MLKLSKVEREIANNSREEYFQHLNKANVLINQRKSYNLSEIEEYTLTLHKAHLRGIVKYLQKRLALCHKDALMHIIYG